MSDLSGKAATEANRRLAVEEELRAVEKQRDALLASADAEYAPTIKRLELDLSEALEDLAERATPQPVLSEQGEKADAELATEAMAEELAAAEDRAEKAEHALAEDRKALGQRLLGEEALYMAAEAIWNEIDGPLARSSTDPGWKQLSGHKQDLGRCRVALAAAWNEATGHSFPLPNEKSTQHEHEQPRCETCGGTGFKTSSVGPYPFYNTDLPCPDCKEES